MCLWVVQHPKAGVGVDALAWPLCFQPPKRLPFRSLAPRPSSRSAWPHAKTIAGKQFRSFFTISSFRVEVTCARTQHQSVSPSFFFRVALTREMTPRQSVLLYAIGITRTRFASASRAHTGQGLRESNFSTLSREVILTSLRASRAA